MCLNLPALTKIAAIFILHTLANKTVVEINTWVPPKQAFKTLMPSTIKSKIRVKIPNRLCFTKEIAHTPL